MGEREGTPGRYADIEPPGFTRRTEPPLCSKRASTMREGVQSIHEPRKLTSGAS